MLFSLDQYELEFIITIAGSITKEYELLFSN